MSFSAPSMPAAPPPPPPPPAPATMADSSIRQRGAAQRAAAAAASGNMGFNNTVRTSPQGTDNTRTGQQQILGA